MGDDNVAATTDTTRTKIALPITTKIDMDIDMDIENEIGTNDRTKQEPIILHNNNDNNNNNNNNNGCDDSHDTKNITPIMKDSDNPKLTPSTTSSTTPLPLPLSLPTTTSSTFTTTIYPTTTTTTNKTIPKPTTSTTSSKNPPTNNKPKRSLKKKRKNVPSHIPHVVRACTCMTSTTIDSYNLPSSPINNNNHNNNNHKINPKNEYIALGDTAGYVTIYTTYPKLLPIHRLSTTASQREYKIERKIRMDRLRRKLNKDNKRSISGVGSGGVGVGVSGGDANNRGDGG